MRKSLNHFLCLKCKKQAHMANKISALLLWASFGLFTASSLFSWATFFSFFHFECRFCWLSSVIMPNICCLVESGSKEGTPTTRWDRIPFRLTFGKHIRCDWQWTLLQLRKDRGAVFVADHPLSPHKRGGEPPLPSPCWEDGKNCNILAESMLTGLASRDERSPLCCYAARESGGSVAISHK